LVERAVARASQRPRHEPERLAAHATQIALVALLHLRLPTTGARAPGDTRRADLLVPARANLAVAAHVRGGRGRLEHGDRNPEPDHPGLLSAVVHWLAQINVSRFAHAAVTLEPKLP